MSKEKEMLDPFYISKIQVIYFQDKPKKGCMYSSLNMRGNYKKFEGDNLELEKYVTDIMKISTDTDSLKIVTVYGFNGISNREDHLHVLHEATEAEIEGEDYYGDQEEECYSYYLDNRSKV